MKANKTSVQLLPRLEYASPPQTKCGYSRTQLFSFTFNRDINYHLGRNQGSCSLEQLMYRCGANREIDGNHYLW